jgi:hypothetical protein
LPVAIDIIRAVIVPGRSVADQPVKHEHVDEPAAEALPLGERLAAEGVTYDEEETEDATTPA